MATVFSNPHTSWMLRDAYHTTHVCMTDNTLIKNSMIPILFLVLLAGPAVLTQVAHAQPEPIKLAIGYIPHIQFAPLYVGIEKGLYTERQIELDIEYGFGIDIFGLLIQEKIDLGLSDSDQLVLAGAKDLGLVALLQYYQKSPVTIVAKSEHIQSPEDFRGKRIGTPMMVGTSHIGVELFLRHYNLQDAVTVEKIGYTQIPSLLSDKIDAAACFFNNEPIKLRQLGAELSQWDVSAFSDIVGASFITSKALTEKRTDALNRFAQATIAAIDYTCRHQDESIQISLPYIDQPEQPDEAFLKEVLAASCRLFESPAGYGALNLDSYNYSIRTLHELGLIDSVYPAEKITFKPAE
ncbi:MAG: ABC transporter substrate-binding protein [bacterium]|nr:ABC transporter substrate-binding protein [bacterium]